ncbi:hypothetical protein [Myxosarcina sp. GI1(2024)]
MSTIYKHTNPQQFHRHIVAYFDHRAKAEKLAKRLSNDTTSVRIERVSDKQARRAIAEAKAGVSVVEIGNLAWAGLIIGSILGAFWGAFTFSGRIPIPGLIAPTLSGGLVVVIFFWAGIFACIAWLLGALIRLFQTSSSGSKYEVRLTLPQQRLVEVERILARAKALSVIEVENPDEVMSTQE